jgi:hypothetical protein
VIATLAVVLFPVLGGCPSFLASSFSVCPTEQEKAMSLGDEIDKVFQREVKSLPAYEKARAASGSGVAPPVDEMNQLLMGLAVAAQRSRKKTSSPPSTVA